MLFNFSSTGLFSTDWFKCIVCAVSFLHDYMTSQIIWLILQLTQKHKILTPPCVCVSVSVVCVK